MDYNKIGEFIATERKAKKLTQAKLAKKIFVSEKTISKWENGNGIPDTNSLVKLCEILEVSLNEFLSGERSSKDANQKDEKLLLNLAKELEYRNKIIWISMWIIIIVSLTALISGVLISTFLIPKGTVQIITVLGICIIFLIPCFFALKLEVSIGSYKCKHCGHEIIPSYSQALWAMHRGTTRYLKCPNCKKRSWCKKILNQKNTNA